MVWCVDEERMKWRVAVMVDGSRSGWRLEVEIILSSWGGEGAEEQKCACASWQNFH